jgi:DNA polymerase-3 subunit epsilon
MLARDAEFVIIDFESTGSVEGYAVEPWQIGLIFFARGRVVTDCRYTSLLHIGARPFNPYTPGRHAVLRAELAAAAGLHDQWPTLRPWLTGRPLVAHHAATERKFLGEAFPLHPFGPWLDTLALSRAAYPRLRSHKLEDLTERLGLTPRVRTLCPDLEPHDALYDAVACGMLLEHILALPSWRDAELEDVISA